MNNIPEQRKAMAKKMALEKKMSPVDQGMKKLAKFNKGLQAPVKVEMNLADKLKHHQERAEKETNADYKEQHQWMVNHLKERIAKGEK